MKNLFLPLFFFASTSLFAQSLIKIDDQYCTTDSLPYTGPVKTFHANGKLAAVYNFEQGKLHHNAIFYDENGMLSMTGFYHLNERDGIWQTWDTNGKMVSRAEYRLGRKVGEWMVRTNDSDDGYLLNYGNGDLLSARFVQAP